MRQARLTGEGRYMMHCISRIVDRRFVITDMWKERFVKILRDQEAFGFVKICAFTVLDNHLHLLLERQDPEELPDLTVDELLKRLPSLYSEAKVAEVKAAFDEAIEAGDEERVQLMLAPYAARMNDISVFMKEIKQRFSQWYNRENERRGTLWEERYKSVLVEGNQHALLTMAAYIDLNAVRAGIVEKPEDYRWCSYGAALGGDSQARQALGHLIDYSVEVSGQNYEANWQEAGELYRLWVYSEGVEVEADPETGSQGRKGVSHEELEIVERLEGKLPLNQALRCRVRYFSDGAVLGSAEFVEATFQRCRDRFGPKRETGARRMRGADWGDLCVIRDLRKTVMVR